MDSWDEIKTAYHVARAGTVSGAADALGVHHATVIRHIDALEQRLGVKLFQRHARGYTPTEAGADLLRVAQTTDDQFTQLAGRIKGIGAGVAGELVVTSLAVFGPMIMPVLARLQVDHPELNIKFMTGERLFRLEYGEAHVAVRGGAAPQEPDNVAQHLADLPVRMMAAQSYIDTYGMPQSVEDLAQHRFVGLDEENSRAPFNGWIEALVPRAQISFRAAETTVMMDAIQAGLGIGLVGSTQGASRHGLVEVLPPQDDWRTPIWLVTHVDLHRTAKVQAVVTALKEAAKTWVT